MLLSGRLRKSPGARAEDQVVESNHQQFLPVLLLLRSGRAEGQGEVEPCGFPESLLSGRPASAQAALGSDQLDAEAGRQDGRWPGARTDLCDHRDELWPPESASGWTLGPIMTHM